VERVDTVVESGGLGRATVQVIMEALDIDFRKVIAKK
jgi:hypothetical protein